MPVDVFPGKSCGMVAIITKNTAEQAIACNAKQNHDGGTGHADVQAVADIFQARIDMGADDVNYPENAAGWQLYAQVQKSGNFVCTIVLPEAYVIPGNVFEA